MTTSPPPSAEPLATAHHAPATLLHGVLARFTEKLTGLRHLLRRRNKSDDAAEPQEHPEGTEPADAKEASEHAPHAPFFLSVGQVMLMVVVALIMGVIGGLWNGYSRFAATIDKQTSEITEKQTQLKKLEKEMTTIRDETQQQEKHLIKMQKKLEDSQHDLAQAVTTAQTQKEELDRLHAQPQPQSQPSQAQQEPPAPQLQTQLQIVSGVSNDSDRRSRGRKNSPPPIGGQCDINAGNPAGGCAQCIEILNRIDRRDSR